MANKIDFIKIQFEEICEEYEKERQKWYEIASRPNHRYNPGDIKEISNVEYAMGSLVELAVSMYGMTDYRIQFSAPKPFVY